MLKYKPKFWIKLDLKTIEKLITERYHNKKAAKKLN